MKVFFSKYKLELIIFLIAILARTFLFFINFEHSDYNLIPTIKGDDGYYELSRGLLDGHGFSWDAQEPFSPNPLRPPVYPLFIAGILYVFKSYWAVLVAQILVGSMIPVLGMRIATKIVNSQKIATIVGLLLALEPFSVLLSVIFYTETVFTFLFFLFFIFFVDYMQKGTHRAIIWSAVFLGLATLVKPTVQYIPIIIPFFILWHFWGNISKKILAHIGIFFALFMLIISPWLYRNYVEFGVVGMSAQPAFNLYIYLVPSVLSIEKNIDFNGAQELFLRKDKFDESTITLATSDYFTSRSLEILKQYPVALLQSIMTTAVTFFTHDGLLTVLQHAGYTPTNRLPYPALFMLVHEPIELISSIKSMIISPMGLVLFGRIAWVIITGFFIFGAFRFFRREKFNHIAVFAIFLVAYFCATTAINGLGVNARFRIPVNVFIFTFALYGYFSLLKDARAHKVEHATNIIV